MGYRTLQRLALPPVSWNQQIFALARVDCRAFVGRSGPALRGNEERPMPQFLGKRKPFIWGGAVTTIVSLTLLAWAREVVAGFCALVRLSGDSKNVADATIVFAVIMVYFLDFAVNTIQAGLRALIVDCAPAHQQERVNAAAGIMTGLGNILAYLAAELDLPTVFWFLGHDQFQILSIIACLALVLTIFFRPRT